MGKVGSMASTFCANGLGNGRLANVLSILLLI